MLDLNDWVEISNHEQLYKSNKKTFDKKTFDKKIMSIIVDGDTLINDIINSYIDKNTKIIRVCNQVKIDIPRMSVKINNLDIVDFKSFIKKIKNLENIKHNILANLTELILLLTTQASFYYQFETINSLYSNTTTNTTIVNNIDTPFIEIVINDKYVRILFKKQFLCLNIDYENIIYKLDTNLKLEINILNNKCKISNCVFNWSITD